MTKNKSTMMRMALGLREIYRKVCASNFVQNIQAQNESDFDILGLNNINLKQSREDYFDIDLSKIVRIK
jgi:hypothetical protein